MSFINYYYQVGLNTSTIISFLKNSNYKTSFFNNNTFNPEVIDCYISKNSPQKEVPFNESLLLKLCFPNNIKIQNSQLGIVEPEFFHFSIENSNDRNKSTYFSCLLVYENLCDLIDLNNKDLLIKKRNKIRISKEENSKSNEKNENYNSSCLINSHNQSNSKSQDNTQDTNTSKCKYKYEKIRSSISLGDNNLFINSTEENEEKSILSVFSNSKFILFPKVILFGLNDMFNIDLKSILYDLYYKILKKSSFFSYEMHVYYLLDRIISPPKGKYSIKFNILNKDYTIQNTKFNDPSFINQELNMTLKYFNVSDILEIYKYVLLEYNVLFFSKKISVLSQFSYSFLTFLHPFTYSLDKYPILHKSYFSVLENMNGGIFGVNLSYYDGFFNDFSINIDEIRRNCLVVDIDKSNLIYFSVKQFSLLSLKNLHSQLGSIQPTNPVQSYKTTQSQSNSQSQIPDFPMRYKSKMIIRLKDYVRKCIINNYRSTLKVKDPKRLSDYKDFLKDLIKKIQIDYMIDSDLPSVVASVILKTIFTYFNASLLKSYRNHMNNHNGHNNHNDDTDYKQRNILYNENDQLSKERRKKKGSGDHFNTSSVKYNSFINSINKDINSINDDLLLNSISKNKNKNSLNLSFNHSNQSSIGTNTYNKTVKNKDFSSKFNSNQQENLIFESQFNKKEYLTMNQNVHGQSADWFYNELVMTKAFKDFIIGRRTFKSKSHLLDVILFDEVISIKENKSLLATQPITSFLDCERFDFEEIVSVDCPEKVFCLYIDLDDCRFNENTFEYDVSLVNDLKEDDCHDEDDSQNDSQNESETDRNERNINRKTEKKKESQVKYRYSKSKTETFPENDSILMMFHEENEDETENKSKINSKKVRKPRKTLLKYKFTYYSIPILSNIDLFLTSTNVEKIKNYNEEVEEVLDLVLSHKYFEKYINTSHHKVSIENYIYGSFYLLLIKSFQFNAGSNKNQENNSNFLVILSFLQLLQSSKYEFSFKFTSTNEYKEKEYLSINILDTIFNYIYLYGTIDMVVKLFNSYMNNSYNTSLHFMLLIEKLEKSTIFHGNSEEETVEKMKILKKDKENESFIYISFNNYAQLYNSIQIRKFEEFNTKSIASSNEDDCNLLSSKDLDYKIISTYPDHSAKKTNENQLKKEKNQQKNNKTKEEIEEEVNIFTNFICIECEKYVDLLLNCMNNDNLYNEIIWMKCLNCQSMVLPKIYIIIKKKEAKEAKESKELPMESSFNENIQTTNIYSPLFIYNTIINELFRLSNSNLNSLFELKSKYSFLFWNAIWYLKLLDLPFFFIVPIKKEDQLSLSKYNFNDDVKKARISLEISSFSFEFSNEKACFAEDFI